MSEITGLFKDLTEIKHARNGRLASWDQRGKNQDYWEIPAGEIEGPGCITHMWMTSSCRKVVAPSILDPVLNASAAPVMEIHPALGVIWDAYDPFYYRKALIKITWDDQDVPSVLAPLGDFFCIGNSYPGNFSSMPFNVSLKPEEAGKYGAPCSVSCYFPMPFNKKAKIEIINENELPFILYFNIDYEMYDKPLPEDTAYFHAAWHRENPCNGWGAGPAGEFARGQQRHQLQGREQLHDTRCRGQGALRGMQPHREAFPRKLVGRRQRHVLHRRRGIPEP